MQNEKMMPKVKKSIQISWTNTTLTSLKENKINNYS
jgi:hypothetical protein